MSSLYLFSLASQHNRWLTARQTTVAGNVANANTPGFKAQDVAGFESAMESARLAMTQSNPNHMSLGDGSQRGGDMQQQESWEVTHSGNSVSLEQELIKAGEINRSYRLNTSVVKTFHRMMLTATKV